jgi:hypothetical protein
LVKDLRAHRDAADPAGKPDANPGRLDHPSATPKAMVRPGQNRIVYALLGKYAMRRLERPPAATVTAY